eukprot:Pgem_evm1s6975
MLVHEESQQNLNLHDFPRRNAYREARMLLIKLDSHLQDMLAMHATCLDLEEDEINWVKEYKNNMDSAKMIFDLEFFTLIESDANKKRKSLEVLQ